MSGSGGKGGGQAFDPKYGKNQALNKSLASTFGYGGQFGGGQFGDWRAQQDPATQAAITQHISSFVDPNSLPGQIAGGLRQAGRQTQKWMDYTPEQLSTIDRAPYMNPYQQDVIDTTMNEMNRQYGLQQQALGDQAIGAGAFGGDRHGIAQAEMARNQMDQTQRWLAALNQANFDQATQQGMFDIGGQQQNRATGLQGAAQLGNLANMGFGMLTGLQGMQRQAGMDQFNMQQALLDRAQQQWGGYTGQPFDNLQAWKAGMPNMSGMASQTTSSKPGLMDIAALGLKAATSIPWCWVAREVYGVDNPDWLRFRHWMLNDAPKWLRNLYGRHGENFAKTVKRRPWLKRILRPIMDSVL